MRGLLLSLLFGATTGAIHAAPNAPRDAVMNKDIEQVFHEQHDLIMAMPGVVGMGIGLCGTRPCIKVYVGSSTTSPIPHLPEFIDGHEIEIEFTGPIRSLPSEP